MLYLEGISVNVNMGFFLASVFMEKVSIYFKCELISPLGMPLYNNLRKQITRDTRIEEKGVPPGS
jgi:hypothetical protein